MAQKIKEPKYCPSCGEPVSRLIEDGAHLYCTNPNCKERKIAKLNYFVTKECMNIDGLSEKTLRKLHYSGLVNEWKDLYEHTADDFIKVGLGEKTAKKLEDELKKSKVEAKAENVLMSLGIPMIGKVSAIKLLEHFGSIKNIENATVDEISKIEGIGNVAASYVFNYFLANKEELENVYKYLQYTYEKPVVAKSSDKLAGLTILATGTFKNFTREGVKTFITENGGKYASGVSKKLSFIVVGDAPGESKITKATELGIKMITEDDFVDMVK